MSGAATAARPAQTQIAAPNARLWLRSRLGTDRVVEEDRIVVVSASGQHEACPVPYRVPLVRVRAEFGLDRRLLAEMAPESASVHRFDPCGGSSPRTQRRQY